jgi:spore germination protein PE
MNRISVVNQVKVESVSTSSTLIIGDSAKITSRTRILAVQRQIAVFFEHEGEFEDYPLFSKAIPKPNLPRERVNMNVIQESPFIKVNRIKVFGVAGSSIMQIGSTCIFDLEARIKNFRQFVTSETPVNRDAIIFESHSLPHTTSASMPKQNSLPQSTSNKVEIRNERQLTLGYDTN